MEIKDEQWKVIFAHSKYEVSTHGRVRVLKTGRILPQRTRKYGYKDVGIQHISGRWDTKLVHRLVASAFIPNDDLSKNTVNHKDYNPSNNNVDNLEWLSSSDNVKDSIKKGRNHDFYGNRFPIEQAQEIAKKQVVLCDTIIFDSITELGIFLGVKQPTVSQALRRGNKIFKQFKVSLYGN